MYTFLTTMLFLSTAGFVPVESAEHRTVDYLQGLGFVLALEARADLPYEYGWHTWHAAHEESVDPLELATLLITEKSGPDMDFSVEGALRKPYTYDWNPDAEGAAKERGLFQVAPTWARKAGYTREQLWDPEINARVAAFVLRSAHESHEKCKTRARKHAKRHDLPYTMLHTHVAHWKCHKSARDARAGRCYVSQKKLQKTMASVTAVRTPSFRTIGAAYNDWYDDQIKALADRMRHRENTRRRRALRVKKKKIRALERELASLRERFAHVKQ